MRLRIFMLMFLALFGAGLAHAQEKPEFGERNPRYRLQPNDAFDVQYRYTPEYNQSVSVQPDGFVSLQLIGNLKVAGLTLEEARTQIATMAAERLRDPEVLLLLKQFVKPHFVVSGEVPTPGRFELYGNISAIEAIAMAGGFKPSAKHSQVILVRRAGKDNDRVQMLDMKEMMKAQNLSEEVQIRDGDLLVVSQNKFSKVEHFMRAFNIGVFWNPIP